MTRRYSKKYRAAQNAKAKAEAERQYLLDVHKKACPSCGDKNTAFILYGLVNIDEQVEKDLNDEVIVLGGCDLLANNPRFQCNSCGYSWL